MEKPISKPTLAITEMLIETGKAVSQKVHQQLLSQSVEVLSKVHKNETSDVIYAIDKDAEDCIEEVFEKWAEEVGGLVLLAEGIGDEVEGEVFPKGWEKEKAKWLVIMDPIDGTRGIMYDKRSAFFLAAAAPYRPGEKQYLSEAKTAVMVEIPTSRSFLSDVLWAEKNKGCFAKTWNMASGEQKEFTLKPSKATTFEGGFAQLVRFFPPGREILSRIEDNLIVQTVENFTPERAVVFEDQYISTGGQLYQLLIGHDRFIGDIRSLLYQFLEKQGLKGGHVCHPYDICTVLIAQEAGLEISTADGKEFDAPFDLHVPADWIGYANAGLRKRVEPVLLALLKKEKLL